MLIRYLHYMELFAPYQKRFFDKSSSCPCGEPEETRDHFVYNCELWKAERSKGFSKNFMNLSLRQLLQNKYSYFTIKDMIMKRFLMSIEDI
ncbi:hypothetical protein CEXT_660341 [Caerostris extrusa]|uniref:Reverse transcriptase zinc-binding domain-containing protein n=1 Tax=Caerostris extrusa TaxID=172846 RepID=A0AAV4SZ26_CAEEX|nr:hypothetical protein CEXT_660341 [Caerostris extrusa]